MQVPLAVLADYANVTIDGKLNIMGTFDVIFAAQVPIVHPQMQLVMKLRSEPAERGTSKQVDVRLLDADGHVIFGISSTLQIPEDFPLTGEIPQVIGLNGLRFEHYGDYAFHVLVNGETKNRVNFSVRPIPTPQPAG